MKTKTAMALIFGLVFQFAQILPGMAAIMADCAPAAESCECCAGLDACPCAKEGEPTQKPLPLAPDSGQTVKAPLARITGTRIALEPAAEMPGTPSVAMTPFTGPWTGYVGVSLSVAFCSFVI